MVLIVDDGTGLATAESYIDVVFFRAYHIDRGNSISIANIDIERNLRLATEYMDLRWGPGAPGDFIDEDQALVWPRDYFVLPLPLQLLRACALYAEYSIGDNLFIDNTNASASITELTENVGPIQTTTKYSGSGLGANGPKHPKVSKADDLMRLISILGVTGGVIR